MKKEPNIDLKMTAVELEPRSEEDRIFDVGRWGVCSVCGRQWNLERHKCCAKGKCITLRKYIE